MKKGSRKCVREIRIAKESFEPFLFKQKLWALDSSKE